MDPSSAKKLILCSILQQSLVEVWRIDMCLIDIILIVLFPVDKSFIAKSIVEVLRWPRPVSTSVHFSLRHEGSSEYIRLCEGRESLFPNFQTFQDPRHKFQGISRLVSDLLFRGLFISTYAGGNDFLEIFALLKSLKIWALENYICLLHHTFTDS